MQKNNIDKHIATKLKNRELSPSSSAWERLSSQLEEQEVQKKKKWFAYFGYVASIVLLISVGYMQLQKKNANKPVDKIIVETPIDTNIVQPNKTEFFKEELIEKKVVATTKNIRQKTPRKEIKTTLFKKFETSKKQLENNTKEAVELAHTSEEKKQEKQLKNEFTVPTIKKDTTVNIKINANDLLYAVTHTKEEVRAYYALKNINRKDLLQTIEKELKASKLKINPETILAEVENEIYKADEEKESFMDKFKTKLSKVIVAIADRNK